MNISRRNKVLIIAEAGVNHNGSFDIAKKLVDAAKNAGADIVKFQTLRPQQLVSKFAKKANYQIKNTENNDSQLDMLKKLALSDVDFIELKKYCDYNKIIFLSTPFDLESIDFLNTLDMPFWKIPSGEITNYPYLVKIANTNKDIVMSTGMSEIGEIEEAINVLNDNGYITIMSHLTLIEESTTLSYPQNINAYFSNLICLGIITDMVGIHKTNKEAYDKIEQKFGLERIKQELVPSKYKSIDVVKSFYRLTDFGKLFIEACIR